MKFKSSELLVNRLELLGNRVHKSEFINEIRTKIMELIKEIQYAAITNVSETSIRGNSA